MAAIFNYGFEAADANFEKSNCEFFTLGDYEALIEQALSTKFINQEELVLLKEWREDPSKWKK
jgi:orotate phosphoribosyltransferase